MKKYVAVISCSAIRDAQVFTGSIEDLDELEYDETQDLWYDDNHHSFFLGVYEGDDEEALRKQIAEEEGLGCFAIELIPID